MPLMDFAGNIKRCDGENVPCPGSHECVGFGMESVCCQKAGTTLMLHQTLVALSLSRAVEEMTTTSKREESVCNSVVVKNLINTYLFTTISLYKGDLQLTRNISDLQDYYENINKRQKLTDKGIPSHKNHLSVTSAKR
uniref:EGF-like domain-containing protein n=1 Tax=Heterorhabditis bacteriophora TaxID=37862 RepID=A0A1I7X567_HETBA